MGGKYEITDLLNGNSVAAQNGADSASFQATVLPDRIGVYLVDMNL